MTFKHKLSVRLALLKDALLLVSAAAIVGCEKPVQLAGPAALVTRVVVSPRQVALNPNQKSPFTAVGLTAAGDTADVRVTWSATGGIITDTFSTGRIHHATYQPSAVPGNYLVIATDPPETGVADTSAVTVIRVPVASVALTPAVASMLLGATLHLTATAQDSIGSALPGRSISWSSSAPAIAAVNDSGLVTANAVGSATVTAASEGKSASATITVSSVPVASVTLSPASASIRVGSTQQLAAVSKDSAGGTLTGRVVTWSSSNTAVANVSTGGLVTGLTAGLATIAATSDGKSGTSTVTVTPVSVASVAVSPAAATIAVGGIQQLTVVTKDSAGSTLTGRVITWASSNTAVASVSGTGLVTGQAAGSATITATSEGTSGTAAVVVNAAPAPGGPSYYVSPSGNDAVACAQAQNSGTPKRTLNNAVGCLSPGSTLLIRGGTYTESLFDNIPAGTSWNAPVTLKAYPGETVTLRPPSGAYRVLDFVDGQSYIVIDGLILDAVNVSYDAVKITYNTNPATGAHHIRLMNGEVLNAPGQGILDAENTGYNEFLNLTVHHNGPVGGGWSNHGLYLGGPHDLVEGCNIYDHSSGYGIQNQYASNVGTILRNNRVHDNKGGIVVNNGPTGTLLYNNLVWNNSWVGIQTTGSTANVQIFNNTVYQNGVVGSYHGIQLGGQAVNTTVQNNIAFLNLGSDISGTGGAGTVIDHNLTGINPGFVNAAAGDFHLAVGSLAIDAGITLTTVPTDLTGVPRPRGRAYDVGALEF